MRLSTKSNGHIIDILFTLGLLCVFTASALMIVLIGSNVYKSTVASMASNYDMRTSLTYISQKIRQNDIENGIHISNIGNTTALVLEQNFNKKDYQTWIYYDNGSIKELFTRKGNKISLDKGREIMQANNFNIEYSENGIYTFTSTDKDGKTASIKSFSRCS